MKKENKIILLEKNNYNQFEFSKHFKNDYLNLSDNPELLKQPLLITNILFKIMADLKDNFFHVDNSYIYVPKEKARNQQKLKLWEDEIINTDKNILKKAYKTSDFLKNRNKKQITQALDFLKYYKNEQYSFKNNQGLTLTTSGGLIKDWYFLDNTGVFEITISLYWANKIVRLEKGEWNNFKLGVAKEFKNIKQRFFLLWIMSVKKYSGTTKNYKDILELYDLSYPNIYELMRGFLAPIKFKLDNNKLNNNWFSFNYFIDEKNSDNLRFIPYDVKPKIALNSEDQNNLDKNKEKHLKNLINYKMKYIKRRHKLSSSNVLLFKSKYLVANFSLFEINYKEFVKQVKKEKKKVTDYLDVDFITIFGSIYKD
jgi:hypothetical protein